MTNSRQVISITTQDGLPLAATLYSAETRVAPLCIIAPAMAVPRRYYDALCQFLREAGLDVVVFDYRGVGDTVLPKPLEDASSFRSCGELDLEAVIQFALQRTENIYLIGHSLGIQALGFAPSNSKIQRVISVASGSGYYGWLPLPRRIVRYFLWRWLMPFSARLLGYFPGKRLGILHNIPKRMAVEWSALCCTPGYLRPTIHSAPEKNFSCVAAHMLVMSFTDDHIMPKAAIDDLHENFASAKRERVHLSPCVLGVKKIGHLGAFRPASKPLWLRWAKWLLEDNPSYSHK